jgi:hypothetical protein
MIDPTISCPTCKTQIKLTESLAAPLLEATRQQYEKRLAQKDSEIERRESAVKDREKAVAKAQLSVEEQVAAKVQEQRAGIAAEEARKARLALSNDLELKTRQLSEFQELLAARDRKLAEAQQQQAELIRKQRQLDDAKRELELTVEKRVQEALTATHAKARQEAEDQLKFKVLEKEQTIVAMQKQIEELRRKADQGSQQLQGEVLELELEKLLSARFPRDSIIPIPKGEYGGDLLHRVNGPVGQCCGTILWEFKQTKNWNDGWLAKLRDDQRAAQAEIAVIVSAALPKGVETFELIESVWVTHPRALLPVALVLRQTLVEVSAARQASEGMHTKTEIVYQYLTGPRFRQRIQAIYEAFTSMQDDLNREKKVIVKQWAKRQEQIERIMQATVGMYGDLEGIVGTSLQQIEGLDFKTLEETDLFELEPQLSCESDQERTHANDTTADEPPAKMEFMKQPAPDQHL